MALTAVFDWKEPKPWFSLIRRALREERRRQDIPLDWIDEESLVHCVEDAVLGAFTHVRLYHACRPTDVQAYYRDGIRPRDDSMRALAHERFAGCDGITPEMIDRAIADLANDHKDIDYGKVFLSLDDRLLVEDGAGHYLIYGSEWLASLAAYMAKAGARLHQEHLKSFGTPTLFTCEVPIGLFPDHETWGLAQSLYHFANERTRLEESQPRIDHTMVLHEVVPPSAIVGHRHPRRIRDPLNNDLWYVWNSNR